MKLILCLVFSISEFSIIVAQTEIDFLTNYNEHIDPLHQLDTIKVLALVVKSDIKYTFNSKTRELSNLRICNFCSNGTRKCTDINDGSEKDMEIFPMPQEYLGNAIKYELNFVLETTGEEYKFKIANDSITVIEKTFHSGSKNIYTFGTKTKNLLQLETISAKDGTSFSYSNFTSYQTINGILVPKTMTYSSSFGTATLEYQSVEFK